MIGRITASAPFYADNYVEFFIEDSKHHRIKVHLPYAIVNAGFLVLRKGTSLDVHGEERDGTLYATSAHRVLS